MQATYTHQQPQVQASPRFQVGDVVFFHGCAMKVWTVINLSTGLHPTQAPGLFYVLKAARMHDDAYFIIPASEIEVPLPLAA